MRADDFTTNLAGDLVQNPEGRLAFVPRMLPPQLDIDNALQQRCLDTAVLLGRLDIAKALPDPHLLIRSFARREAVITSYIENTFADYDQLGLFERDPSLEKAVHDVREVHNAERAILAGTSAVHNGRPISCGLLTDLQSMLLDGVRGGERKRGVFRSRQVYIGNAAQGMDGARFVPPPFTFVRDLMENLEGYIRTPQDATLSLLRIGVVHYQFESIHPYEDGNGRVGRLLVLMQLCASGLLSLPVLNPSLYFEQNRRRYYDALLDVSLHGRWNEWLAFFVDGIAAAARDAIERLDAMRRLSQRYHEQLRSSRNPAALLRVLDELFVSPRIRIPDVAQIAGVSYPTAQSYVNKLVAAGILREMTDTSPRTFRADEIMATVGTERTVEHNQTWS